MKFSARSWLILFLLLVLPPMRTGAVHARDFDRRLQRIKQIAAESNGKIEIRVLSCSSPQTATQAAAFIPENGAKQSWMTRGLRLFYRADYTAALACFTNACEQESDWDSWYWRGECLAQLGDRRAALGDFAIYLPGASEEKRDDVLLRSAMLHWQLGNAERCRRLLRHLVAMMPKSDLAPIATQWLENF